MTTVTVLMFARILSGGTVEGYNWKKIIYRHGFTLHADVYDKIR